MNRRWKSRLLQGCLPVGVVAALVWVLWPRDYSSTYHLVPNVPATEMELVSIYPEIEGVNPNDDPSKLYGYRILGSLKVEAAEEREELLMALREAIRAKPRTLVKCFNPRHVLRVKMNGDRRDYVICFECQVVQVYVNDERTSDSPISSKTSGTFNRYLKQADIPIATWPNG